MTDAVGLIKAYAGKRISAKELSHGFDSLLAADPSQHHTIRRVLEKARAAGLPEPAYAHLVAKLPAGGETTPTGLPAREAGPGAGAGPGSAERPAPASRVAGEPITAPPRHDDPTEVNPSEPDHTQRGSAPAEDTFERRRRADFDTSSSWPVDSEHRPEVEFTAGSMLRGRFRLLSPLGEGGMGMVWKAVDLLKEEARDRNPFVAIKLLHGDFKEHPEAFIALQRETAKAQRLAHPNIATTFDFDRDDQTGTVYMTMEVLEGDDLAGFIRNLPEGGLGQDEAMALVEQLAQGLAYAHDNQLVHSDLKPGNCFITKERVVKLLDFGIAQASKTRMDAEGETTLFDPGEFGALTPTYATIEMFEGLDPDPRDDIYALAIITYQLLTGRHPFDRKSAPKAKELGLTMPPVAGLTKRQNRALAGGLALTREERTPTVGAFLEGLRPRKNYTKTIAIAAAALLAVLGLGLYPIIEASLERAENEEIIARFLAGDEAGLRDGLARLRALDSPTQRDTIRNDARVEQALVDYIARGNEAEVQTGLALIEPEPATWQRAVRNAAPARRAIFELFAAKRDAAANPSAGRYDFPRAEALLSELAALYEDSAQVLEMRQTLVRERDTALSALDAQFNRMLEQGRLVPRADAEDIADVLAVVRQISPAHPLLQDPRVALRFEELARDAIAQKTLPGYERAAALLAASRDYPAQGPTLDNLRFEVSRELKRRTELARIAALEQRLAPAAATARRLADFDALREDLTTLVQLAPEHRLSTQLGASLERLLARDLANLRARGRHARALGRLAEYAPVLGIRYIETQRGALSQEPLATVGAGQEVNHSPNGSSSRSPSRELDRTLDRAVATVESMVGSDTGWSNPWNTALQVPYRRMVALSPTREPLVMDLRQRVAAIYEHASEAALADAQFALADEVLTQGTRLQPEHEGFAALRARLEQARAAEARRQAEARERARIDGMKRTLLTQASANQPAEAHRLLRTLGTELAADDPFLTTEAPHAVASAYQALARRSAGEARWSDAAKLANAAHGLAPALAGLADELAGYRRERAKEAELVALRRRVRGAGPFQADRLRAALANLRTDFPERYPALVEELAGAMTSTLATRAPTTSGELTRLAADLATLERVFPDHHRGAARRVHDAAARAIRQREREDASAASALLAKARAVFPEATNLAALRIDIPAKPSPLADTGLQEVQAGHLTRARTILDQVRIDTPDAANLSTLAQTLEARERKARDDFAAYRRYVEAQREREGRPYLLRARGLWKDNPDPAWRLPNARVRTARGQCTASLAGLGKGRGTCYDRVDGKRGPVLVVIPAAEGLAAYAIGKYEVSVGEFNQFCQATGACPVRSGKGKVPITGVSADLALAYTGWLSQHTAHTYRLPTDQEWLFAAEANGVQPRKNFNCTVKLGNKVIKGQDLVNARSGDANGWGLTNYVGNAREWVRHAGALRVRGGAHGDPLSRCDLTLSRPHGGEADPQTGFRVLRELG